MALLNIMSNTNPPESLRLSLQRETRYMRLVRRLHFSRDTQPPYPESAFHRGPSMMTHSRLNIDELADNFSLFDDWEDRYRYIIDLGRALASP